MASSQRPSRQCSPSVPSAAGRHRQARDISQGADASPPALRSSPAKAGRGEAPDPPVRGSGCGEVLIVRVVDRSALEADIGAARPSRRRRRCVPTARGDDDVGARTRARPEISRRGDREHGCEATESRTSDRRQTEARAWFRWAGETARRNTRDTGETLPGSARRAANDSDGRIDPGRSACPGVCDLWNPLGSTTYSPNVLESRKLPTAVRHAHRADLERERRSSPRCCARAPPRAWRRLRAPRARAPRRARPPARTRVQRVLPRRCRRASGRRLRAARARAGWLAAANHRDVFDDLGEVVGIVETLERDDRLAEDHRARASSPSPFRAFPRLK